LTKAEFLAALRQHTARVAINASSTRTLGVPALWNALAISAARCPCEVGDGIANTAPVDVLAEFARLCHLGHGQRRDVDPSG
jgi:hypothetical protein